MPAKKPILLCDWYGQVLKEYPSATEFCYENRASQPMVYKFLTGKATAFRDKYLLIYKEDYVNPLQCRQLKFSKRMFVILDRRDNTLFEYFNTCKDLASFFGMKYDTMRNKIIRTGAHEGYIIVAYEDYDPEFDYAKLYRRKRARRPVVEVGTHNQIIEMWNEATDAAQACYVTRERMRQVLNGKTYVTCSRIFVYYDEYDPNFDYESLRYITPDGRRRKGDSRYVLTPKEIEREVRNARLVSSYSS